MPASDVLKTAFNEYEGDDTQLKVIQNYFLGKFTAEDLDQKYDLRQFFTPEQNEYWSHFAYNVKRIAIFLAKTHPKQSKQAQQLLDVLFNPQKVQLIDIVEDFKPIDLFDSAPSPAVAASGSFTAGATLLKDGTSPGVMEKLGIDKDTAVQVTVKDGDMTITTEGMQGGAAAHSDHLSGGASRQVIISALQTLLKQSGAELLPDEAFTKMSTEALAETVVDLTRVRHNF